MKVPLNNSFAAMSIIGLILSVSFTIFGRLQLKWGITLIFFFIVMVIAVMTSIFPEDDFEKNE
jgi:hypothetical protein